MARYKCEKCGGYTTKSSKKKYLDSWCSTKNEKTTLKREG